VSEECSRPRPPPAWEGKRSPRPRLSFPIPTHQRQRGRHRQAGLLGQAAGGLGADDLVPVERGRKAGEVESPQARALGFFFPSPIGSLCFSLSPFPLLHANAHKEAGRRGQADRRQADRQGRVQGLRDGGVEGGEGLREGGGREECLFECQAWFWCVCARRVLTRRPGGAEGRGMACVLGWCVQEVDGGGADPPTHPWLWGAAFAFLAPSSFFSGGGAGGKGE
jgi:hypothetical protein